jgi:hypothetical protein
MGGGSTKVTNEAPPPTAQETELTSLNLELAKRQLANIDQLAPIQQKLLQQASSALDAQTADQAALDAAISPADRAAQTKQQFDQATKSGELNTQLLQKQLDQLNSGGAATPEQQKLIADATDRAIAAGTGDIDTQTKRGIGMISDELANARGLRLSDAPIGSEAALLTRAAGDQKSSLINNLRANQANANLNYPMAVQGIQLAQQGQGNAVQDFQATLRQQAVANRAAMVGQGFNNGLGIASSPGIGLGAMANLAQTRGMNSAQKTSPSTLSAVAPYASAASTAYLAYAMMAA